MRCRVNDKFRIGSNTKTFVITVLLQLVQEGRLSLDDTVAKFKLNVNMPDADRITIRQLVEMRSGLIDLYALPAFQALDIKPQAKFDRHHWLQLALDQPRLFAPGTQYNYSNTNYMLLGMIIEAVTQGHRRTSDRNPPPRAAGLAQHDLPGHRSGDAVALRARLHARCEGSLAGRERRPAAVGLMGGRRHDLGHGRHEDVGQSLRHRNREQRGDAEGSA